MKYFKHFPEIGLYVYLSYMSIFIITGGWQFLIKLFFDFGYIRVVINLSIIASSALIIWIMRTYFKKAYVTFYNSVIHFKKSLGISIATLIIVFLSYSINIYLFSNLSILSITRHPDFWATTNFIAKSMLAGITVAIGEEIVYRGFLFNAIQKKNKKENYGNNCFILLL